MNFTKGYTFGATETVTNAKLHALVDNASASGITDSDIAADADISASKINFDLSDYVTIAGDQTITGAKTFSNTTTFSTPLANTNIAAITQASKVAGSSFYALASCISGAGQLPRVNQALQDIDALLPAQGSANGKFLTSNGSVSSWASVLSSSSVAGTTTIFGEATTERTTSSTSYTKLKEITIYLPGTYTVTFDMKGDALADVVQRARIYLNGAEYGTEQTQQVDSYVTKTQNLSFSYGDVVQLYAKSASGSRTVYVKNFYIKGSFTTINTD